MRQGNQDEPKRGYVLRDWTCRETAITHEEKRVATPSVQGNSASPVTNWTGGGIESPRLEGRKRTGRGKKHRRQRGKLSKEGSIKSRK